MSYLRPEIDQLSGYIPGEQPTEDGLIKLNTNENPYPPSPAVIEALRARIGPALRLYPHPSGAGVRAAVSRTYGIDPARVFLGNGSDEILNLLIRAVVAPGQLVAAPDPTYSLYPILAAINGVEYRSVPFETDYQLPDDWPDARLTFLANPNSPSGTMLSPERVAAFARRLSGLLVVDEAYVDFADDDCLGLIEAHDNLVVLRTFSKSFSLAGLRLGFAVGPAELIAGLNKIKDSYNVNQLALAAGEAALDSIAWMRENAARIRRTRARLTQTLKDRGLSVYPSGANFVLLRLGAHALEVQQALARRKILVRHLDHPRTVDCLRITIGTDEQMTSFTEQLFAILEERERA